MNVTKQLYQWDTGQKLTECTGIYVDYLIGDEVYRVEITDGTCIIPDELLQTSGRYKVWECMADNTLREFAFKVLPRPIPPNYVFTPTEQLTFEGLVQKETNKFNTNAIEKLNAYNANADNRVAEFNAQTEQIQADVSELKSDLVDFYGIGKNLYNPNTQNKKNNVYVINTNGDLQSIDNYTTVVIPIDTLNNCISVNSTYTFITFFNRVIDINEEVVNAHISGYISGVLAELTPLSNISIPSSAKCVVISTNTNNFNTLQVEYGSQITDYEPYNKGIDGKKIKDKTIPLSKLEGLPVGDYDTSLYELPFISNKKVCCNKVNDSGTAYYIGVDTKGTPNKIVSKFIMEQGSASGTIALILQKNGLTKVSDITNGSFHLVITSGHIALNILLNGSYLYNPIDTDLTHSLLMDGTTENTVTVEVSGNDVTVTINNGTYTDTYNGTFTHATYNLSDFIGRYAQFEHFCNGNRDNLSMPMFTYWEVSGESIFVTVKDNFSRPDGLLDRTPNGYQYHVFTNANNGY